MKYIVSTSEEKMTEFENMVNAHFTSENQTKRVIEVKKHLENEEWFFNYDLFINNVRPTLKAERESQIGEFVGDNVELRYEIFDNDVAAGLEIEEI